MPTEEWYEKWEFLKGQPRTPAQRVVHAIFRDLSGRKGIGNYLEDIDGEIADELLCTLVAKAEKAIADEPMPVCDDCADHEPAGEGD